MLHEENRAYLKAEERMNEKLRNLVSVIAGAAVCAKGMAAENRPDAMTALNQAAKPALEQVQTVAPSVAAQANPAVVSGLDLQVSGTRVLVQPGRIRLDGKVVEVPRATSLDIAPAEQAQVIDEPYQLSPDRPNQWRTGTHLTGCNSRSTVLPGSLVPGSVQVKLKDGTVMEKDKDYLIDEHWCVLGIAPGGRITTSSQVLISYKVAQMRLDAIEVNASGEVTLRKGTPKKNSPLPPAATSSTVRLAHVFMPYLGGTVEPWQVFVIGAPYAEPDAAESARRAAQVAKTLGKLRRGEKVTVVTWGDSVTCGCDASKPELGFPQLFASRLAERFPSAKVKYVNAGIGGTSTIDRLPGLDKDVLSAAPDLVVVEYVNDMGLPLDVVKKNYEVLISRIRAAGAEVVVIAPHFTWPEWMGHPHSRGGETRPAVGVIREVAKAADCAFADVSSRWAHLEKEGIPYLTYLDSGINHPDDRGHELFVTELMTFFPK